MSLPPSNIITTVPPMVGRSLILFPSAPASLPVPVLGFVPGGSIPAVTYYAYATWIIQTQDGTQYESLPGPTQARAVADGDLLTAAISSVPTLPYAVIGWNLYATTSLVGPPETLQATNISLSGTWTEPTSGLVTGTLAPATWGYELIFKYPGRKFPYFSPKRYGHDDFSTAGWQQSITWYIDQLMPFEVPYISGDTDAWAWKQFLNSAIQRVPFDFYQDSTQQAFQTLILMDDTPQMAYKSPGLYSLKLSTRQVILAL